MMTMAYPTGYATYHNSVISNLLKNKDRCPNSKTNEAE